MDSFRQQTPERYPTNSSPQKRAASPPAPQPAGVPNSTSYPNSLRTCTNNNNTSFQHNHIRATLPNDYKPNDYNSKTRTNIEVTSYPAEPHMSRTIDPKTQHRLNRSTESAASGRSNRTLERQPVPRVSRPPVLQTRVNGESKRDNKTDDE